MHQVGQRIDGVILLAGLLPAAARIPGTAGAQAMPPGCRPSPAAGGGPAPRRPGPGGSARNWAWPATPSCRAGSPPGSHAVKLRVRVDALLPLAPVEDQPNSPREAAGSVEFPTGWAMAPHHAGPVYGPLVRKGPADRDAIDWWERSPAIDEGRIAHRPRTWSICLEKEPLETMTI